MVVGCLFAEIETLSMGRMQTAVFFLNRLRYGVIGELPLPVRYG